jgi:hypothetical protein
MNNEFEWRSQMRKLGGAIEPARDLWPAIQARIAATPARRRGMLPGLAIAATLLVGLGAATFAWRAPTLHVKKAAPDVEFAAQAMPDGIMPDHPVLAAAAQDLDDASTQLQQALEQRPDAVFLVGLLNRTNSQRLRLLRQSAKAG